jgi:hypothetical protein
MPGGRPSKLTDQEKAIIADEIATGVPKTVALMVGQDHINLTISQTEQLTD